MLRRNALERPLSAPNGRSASPGYRSGNAPGTSGNGLVAPPPSPAPRPEGGVRAEGLGKAYEGRSVVSGLDLDVPPGTVHGFLGPNGAGKSTTIKMLCGLVTPDQGSAQVAGHDVRREPLEVKRRIGYLPEEFRPYERITARELLVFTGRMFGLEREEARSRSEDLLEWLELSRRDRDRMLVDVSMGTRKKVGLGCALIHGPRVVFLDEPFNGIDPVSSRVIRTVLLDAAERGLTLFFSSHVLDTVERMCHEVSILKDGRRLAGGTVAEIRAAHGFDETTSLEEVFVELVGGSRPRKDLAWMR